MFSDLSAMPDWEVFGFENEFEYCQWLSYQKDWKIVKDDGLEDSQQKF